MVDNSWRAGVGCAINFSSDSEEEGNNNNEKEEKDTSDKESLDYPENGSHDEEDLLLAKYSLENYIKYGSTPPRERIARKQKSENQRKKDDLGTPTKIKHHDKLKRRHTTEKSRFVPDVDSYENEGESRDTNRTDMQLLQKSLTVIHDVRWLQKREAVDFTVSAASTTNVTRMDRTGSQSFKVETSNRFMSLTSRPVACKGLSSPVSSGTQTPRKISRNQGCPADRIEFYRIFSALIKMGNSEKQSDKYYLRQKSHEEQLYQNELKDLIWLELQAWHAERSPQDEDLHLCSERKNIKLVLEEILNYKFRSLLGQEEGKESAGICTGKREREMKAQAKESNDKVNEGSFPNDFTTVTEDQEVTSDEMLMRTSSTEIYDEFICDSTYRPSDLADVGEVCNRETWRLHDISQKYADDSVPVVTTDVGASSKGSRICVTGYSEILMPQADSFLGCLSVFCRACNHNQNVALREVQAILAKLEAAEGLYPSSKAFGVDYPEHQSPKMIGKVKAMCMWYNLTRQLREKTDSLGQVLSGLGAKHLPWPRWDEDVSVSSGIAEASCNDMLLAEEEDQGFRREGSFDGKHEQETQTTPVGKSRIQFSCEKDEENTRVAMSAEDGHISTNPSDSNNSTDSCATGSDSGIISRQPSYLTVDGLQDYNDVYPSTSPYQQYVEKVLKAKGLKQTLQNLRNLIRNPLKRAHKALEKPPSLGEARAGNPSFQQTPQPPEETIESHPTCTDENEEMELSRYGTWSPEYMAMGLPSFRAVYAFLCRIPLDITQECLKLRLDQKPLEPSLLSIRQLMRECKEALKAAVMEQQKFIQQVKAVIWDPVEDKTYMDSFEKEMNDFDFNMKRMLEVYLDYLQQWVHMIQQDSSLLTASYHKNLLEEQWTFVKAICVHIPRGQALAGNTFCQVASSMLSAIGDYVGQGTDECMSAMYGNTVADEESSTKNIIYEACRGFQSVFHESRERAMKAVSFAKMLRKDLEIATEFEINTSPKLVLQKLQETNHVRIIAPHSSNHLMFIPGSIKHERKYIKQLLDMHCSGDCDMPEAGSCEEGYLVLMRCVGCSTVPGVWTGDMINIQPTAETTITLSEMEVDGLLLITCNTSKLLSLRKHFQKVMGDVIILKHEHRASTHVIASSLKDLKNESLLLLEKITQNIRQVEEKCDVRGMVDLDDTDRAQLAERCREILHQCYKFGFEYHKEITRLVTGEARPRLATGLVSFAHMWMVFVKERCERGRGLRPRWASQGLEFLMTACEPQYTRYLSAEEFQKLKSSIDECVSHVVGTADKSPSPHMPCRSRGPSPSPHGHRPIWSSRSVPDGSSSPEVVRSVSVMSSKSEPSGSTVEPPSGSPFFSRRKQSRQEVQHIEDTAETPLAEPSKTPTAASWQERVVKGVLQLEEMRDKYLQKEGQIGKVSRVHVENRIHIKVKSVTFTWTRGIQIGQGQFGKVYTAVNNNTGEYMAMKEIQLQPNDHRTLKNVADELRIFEGIRHDHLVRYYGVEIHREEMLIFMEYCADGSLDKLISETEGGLPEELVRRYTRQLLDAISVLHLHKIVHRDIKSANIFLTDEGNSLKLGDFGCSTKIKSQTTMPGEIIGLVGTEAYMAPEVFTKAEGQGRTADIWSLGCVVVEMASGKRPWHELQGHQIIFKVGMGHTPKIPKRLGDEGHQFLTLCLQHDPRERATAATLLDHPFVKVYVDEECVSLPHLSHIEAPQMNFISRSVS